MNRNVEFKPSSTRGRGPYEAVLVDQEQVGWIRKNLLDQWCYFTDPSELNAEITNGDLDALKREVTAKLSL